MARIKMCNRCGKDITNNDHALFSINYDYGYDSDYEDATLELDLCSKCVDLLTQHLIETCKINPVINQF